jgi:hypothetical protein
MKYTSGSDFRRALEARLRTLGQSGSVPLVRLRKLVAFDRFLARLVTAQPGTWILKGGLALQLRLGERARTTKDMDFLLLAPRSSIHARLVEAVSAVKDDWFEFQVEQPLPAEGPANRFHIRAFVDGKPFELFHVDVGLGDPMIEPADQITMPPLLAFAGIAPTIAPCYPVTQQIAEKVHAYTRPHGIHKGSRVKDLVDILLLGGLASLSGRRLSCAIQATFDARHTHPIPHTLPTPPANWSMPFRKLAAETHLSWKSLDEAYSAFRDFLEPIISGGSPGCWNQTAWRWQKP